MTCRNEILVTAVSCIVLSILLDAAFAVSTNTSDKATSDSQNQNNVRSDENSVQKGMKPFFDMVEIFLGIVQPEPYKITKLPWLNLSTLYVDGQFNSSQLNDWRNWASYLIGFVVCAAVGVVFVVVVPITGLVFCCCRCAGKCGGELKPYDPKHAACKRRSYCTLLLLLNTVALAGVVCAFLSNQIVYEKLQNQNNEGFVGKLTSGINGLQTYINNTVDDIGNVIINTYINSKTEIMADIKNATNEGIDDALSIINATALLEQMKSLSKDVNQTQDDLNNVAVQLALLSSLGNGLADNLTIIANKVESACADTSKTVSCNQFRKEDYGVAVNFSTLDNLSQEAQNVSQSLNMSRYIKEAENNIVSIKVNATEAVANKSQVASDSVDDVQRQIQEGITNIKNSISDVTNIASSATKDLQDTQNDISTYSKYWWIGGLVVSSLLLLVVILYYVGVLFGLCGESPGFGAQCCNTGNGANFLLAGVGFTFIFAWVLMIICAVTFVLGGVIYTELCQYLNSHNPNDLKPFSDVLSNVLDLKNQLYKGKDVDLNLAQVLNDCQQNKAIYGVMQLDHMVNLSQVTSLDPLRKQLSGLKDADFNIPPIEILSANLNETVSQFANSGIDSINFTKYYEQVQKDLTYADLEQLSRVLKALAEQDNIIPKSKVTLLECSQELRRLSDTTVLAMKTAVGSLNNSLHSLDNQQNIKPKARALLDGLQSAQDNFNVQRNDLVKTQVARVIERVISFAERIINNIQFMVRNEVGNCGQIYSSFYQASDAVCIAVLEPWNGFWFSLGWCLFFFIPCLILAVKLAGLYRRENEEKEYDDPNYIMYTGRNQDTIPLTSRFEW